ncbi:hypothetical protein HETIRDRAFT_433754 [Heterobasidion irregulare TC 32-1]|uniref:Uncharacterized protein n=1 Tax=Heterobasidion irregulare (strain TC 32-1) TaxID=747525 RepID=W4KD87_HETIT|nr:uncharacterized protein HETIRDRAFT_433754 [Heterobasidion irregulare TC 32-1]ETW83051.1 hypothetical protein HETIRDRAFT_433754 [Heterobasidion irregulare TC 32-1]
MLPLHTSLYHAHDISSVDETLPSSTDPAAPSGTTLSPIHAPTPPKQNVVAEAIASVAACLDDLAESLRSIRISIYDIVLASVSIVAVLMGHPCLHTLSRYVVCLHCPCSSFRSALPTRLFYRHDIYLGTEESTSTGSTSTTGRSMDPGARTTFEGGQAT